MGDVHTPFDHQADPVLGAALRAALAPSDSAGFVARVVAAADRQPAPMVDVLARWARMGIAAAALAALVASYAVARGTRTTPEVTSRTDAASVIEGVDAPDAVSLIASYQGR
jgi:hypothetical protein